MQYDDPWYDGRIEGTFFDTVYRPGDASVEGHLEDVLLGLDQRTDRECNLVEELLELQPRQRILDCPCGYGRHSLELARRGYDVVGVDLNPSFIAEARQTLASLPGNLACEFMHGDMRTLPSVLRDFDCCINMFFSFGFFVDAQNLLTLKEFRRCLKPGGRLLIHTDVNYARVLKGIYGDRSERTLSDGSTLRIYEAYNRKAGRLEGEWSINSASGQATRRAEYSVRIYSDQELAYLLHVAGFDNLVVFGIANQAGLPEHHDADHFWRLPSDLSADDPHRLAAQEVAYVAW